MLIYVKCNLYHARDTQEGNIKDKAKSAVYVPESTVHQFRSQGVIFRLWSNVAWPKS